VEGGKEGDTAIRRKKKKEENGLERRMQAW